jgi:hypothetical protein
MILNKKNCLLIFFLLVYTSIHSQNNNIKSVLLSVESDYHYNYKPKTREEILINFQENIVYYRKKSTKKFKVSNLPVNTFFKDSVNYEELDDLIIGTINGADVKCEFRNKGSIKITVIYGDSNHNYSESFEFGSVICCMDTADFTTLLKIEAAHLNMRNLLFK